MTEPILFREILQSHQALSQRGWAIVFGALGLFFASFGLAMFVSGAWPVIGFLGLEIGGIHHQPVDRHIVKIKRPIGQRRAKALVVLTVPRQINCLV